MSSETMRRALGAAALAIALAICPAADAAAPGQWKAIAEGPGAPGPASQPALHRTPDGVLHVAWIHTTAPLDQSLLERTISAAGDVQAGGRIIVAHWVDLADAAFLDEPGGPRVFFGGQQTTQTGSPLGVQTATPAGAGWGPPAQLTDTYGILGAAQPRGGVPLLAFQSLSRVAARAGLAPAAPLSIFASGLTDISPNVVADASGRAAVVWCAFGAAGGGIHVQQADTATGAPLGPAAVMPGSLVTYAGGRHSTCVLQTVASRRMPAVARAGGGLFVAASSGYPTLDRVLVWRVGSPSAATVASRPGTSHVEPQLAAAPDGRVWAAWIERAPGSAPVIVARRSNRAVTTFGAPVRVRAPGGWSSDAFGASATAARLDVVAQLGQPSGARSVRHTVALPGLTLKRVRVARRAGGRRAVTYRVLDAGDPVRGARVRAGRVRGLTSSSGNVTLVLTGSLRATATNRGYTAAAG